MKERRTFICKVKQVNEQHMNTTEATILVVLVIVLFIAGFLVSWKLLNKPLSTNQFEVCEQIARYVYDQKENIIVELPEGFSVSTTEKTIKVRLNSGTHRGKVIAKLQKGELEMTRDREIGLAIIESIAMGFIFILAPLFIILILKNIYEKMKK